MIRQFIGFSADQEYLKKVEYLQEHLSKFNITKVNRTEVLKHAIDQLYKDYKGDK